MAWGEACVASNSDNIVIHMHQHPVPNDVLGFVMIINGSVIRRPACSRLLCWGAQFPLFVSAHAQTHLCKVIQDFLQHAKKLKCFSCATNIRVCLCGHFAPPPFCKVVMLS